MEHNEFQLTIWCEPCAEHIEYVEIGYPDTTMAHENGAYKQECAKAKAIMVAHSKTRAHRKAVAEAADEELFHAQAEAKEAAYKKEDRNDYR